MLRISFQCSVIISSLARQFSGLFFRVFFSRAITSGATGPKIDAALAAYVAGNRAASSAVLRAPDFDSAVAMAHDAAAPGDIVLLSPASASFDAFRDFEERGRHFKDLVNALFGEE